MNQFLFVGGSLDGQVRQVDGSKFYINLPGPGFNQESYSKRCIEVTVHRSHYVFVLDGIDLDCVIDMLFTKYIAFTEMNDELCENRRKKLVPMPPEVLNDLRAFANDDVKAIYTSDKSDICVGSHVRVLVGPGIIRDRVCRTTQDGERITSVAIDAPGVSQSMNFDKVELDD